MSSQVLLNLVVIRSADIEKTAAFYKELGLVMIKQRHGNGPEHYSAELGVTVFEIYPLDESRPSTIGTRLGFRVNSLGTLIERFTAIGARILTPPRTTAQGQMAVMEDFDGHRIELTEEYEEKHLLD